MGSLYLKAILWIRKKVTQAETTRPISLLDIVCGTFILFAFTLLVFVIVIAIAIGIAQSSNPLLYGAISSICLSILVALTRSIKKAINRHNNSAVVNIRIIHDDDHNIRYMFYGHPQILDEDVHHTDPQRPSDIDDNW